MSAALFVLVLLALIVWLLVGLFRPRPRQETTAPRQGTSSLVKVVLFLLLAWLVADVLAISVLAPNARNTFSHAPRPPEQKPPKAGEERP
jgi:hypothetical protein